MNNLIIGGHGLGDCMLALQCGLLAEKVSSDKFNFKFATRDEVFNPLKHFFSNKCPLEQIPEQFGENNSILNINSHILNEFKEKYSSVYYVIPDLLFQSPHAFNFKTYNLSPHVIKSYRLNIERWKPEKRIYIGLVTMAEHHKYQSIPALIKALAKKFSDYEIYFPNVKKWGGADLDWGDFSKKPDNLFIHENPRFEDSIDILKKSCFGIFADNGPSHLAYHLGMPRIIMDNFIDNPKWISRWREDPTESIPMSTSILDIVLIVEENISFPQASLIPKKMCNSPVDMSELLGFKY